MNEKPGHDSQLRFASLSERQKECLELAGRGLTSKEIARELDIAPSTVDNHVGAAIDRLGARNRAEAVRFMSLEAPPDQAGHGLVDRGPGRHLPAIRPTRAPFPPLGGSTNDLPPASRFAYILRIAAVAIGVASVAILSIIGVVNVMP